MSLLNKKAVKQQALKIAMDKFHERNRTRAEIGLAPVKSPESRVSKHFLDVLESRLMSILVAMVRENKTGVTL